jgi:hypothetical protein
MSGFQPTRTLINPPDPPDYLSNAVLQSLSRPPLERYTWGAFATFLFGALSFGILPLLFPLRRGRQYRLIERDQLLHLSDWMRSRHSPSPGTPGEGRGEGSSLPLKHDDIYRDATIPFLIGMASAFVTFWILTTHLFQGWGFRELYRVAFGTLTPWGDVWLNRLLPIMLIGQFAHWWTIVSLSRSARHFARRFNDFARTEGISPVAIPEIAIGLRPLWLLGSIVFLAAHAPWGAMMMLAGAAQRRYINHTARQFRLELAQRVREVMSVRQPAAKVPVATSLRERCRDEKCRSPLPPVAKFCPRCGRRC